MVNLGKYINILCMDPMGGISGMSPNSNYIQLVAFRLFWHSGWDSAPQKQNEIRLSILTSVDKKIKQTPYVNMLILNSLETFNSPNQTKKTTGSFGALIWAAGNLGSCLLQELP